MIETTSFLLLAILQAVAAVGLWRNGMRSLAVASACYAIANVAYLWIAWTNIKKPHG